MASNSASAKQIGFFDDLVRCETRLYNAVGARLRAHGLTTSQFESLRYLRDHPASRVAEMATNFAAGVGAISKGTDRLEERGWVTRVTNPADGRSSFISLTARGAELLGQAERTFGETLRELLGAVGEGADFEAAAKTLAALRAALESTRAGLPTG